MPIRYELDDVRRRVVVTVEGLFQTDDIFAIFYDLRGMTGDVPLTVEI
jgi:hypothetical protein